jgi:hypothetical protein
MKWTLLLGVAAVALLVVAPMTMAADHAKGEKGKNMVRGEIKSIETNDTKAITGITLTVKAKEEGAAPETKVVKVTTDTKVQTFAKPAEGEKPTPKEGKIDDLKVGQRVSVKMTDDGASAATITIAPAGAGAHRHGEKKGKDKTE